MISEPSTWLVLAATVAVMVAIAFYWVGLTRGPRGAKSLPEPFGVGTWSPRKPSIVRSATNSTASITVPADPAHPLAFFVEPASGSGRSVKLTVLYEQSDAAMESLIRKSDDFASRPDAPTFKGVDDPAWLSRVMKPSSGPTSGGS